MFKLCFFVPASHLEAVKTAIFQAGAGRIGDYELCCWQTLGEGQFKPLPGSQPHIGDIDKLATVAEYKVELVCDSANIKSAIAALRSSHPYEEPAFDIIQLINPDNLGSEN